MALDICGHDPSFEEVAAAIKGRSDQSGRITILTLKNWNYDYQVSAGTGCRTDLPVFDYRVDNRYAAYCGATVETAGTFSILPNGKIHFDGKRVKSTALISAGLGILSVNDYPFRIQGDALILVDEYRPGSVCGSTHYQVFVPDPGF